MHHWNTSKSASNMDGPHGPRIVSGCAFLWELLFSFLAWSDSDQGQLTPHNRML
jgi:hypothetical protein